MKFDVKISFSWPSYWHNQEKRVERYTWLLLRGLTRATSLLAWPPSSSLSPPFRKWKDATFGLVQRAWTRADPTITPFSSVRRFMEPHHDKTVYRNMAMFVINKTWTEISFHFALTSFDGVQGGGWRESCWFPDRIFLTGGWRSSSELTKKVVAVCWSMACKKKYDRSKFRKTLPFRFYKALRRPGACKSTMLHIKECSVRLVINLEQYSSDVYR